MDEQNYRQDFVEKQSVGSFIWDLVKVLIISLIIIVPIRYFIAQPFIVSSISMQPNLYEGQYLIVDELSYHLREPVRGEIVVFKYPKDTSQYFIKRLIGLPGETVEIKDNHFIVYNKEAPQGLTLEESYLPAGTLTVPGTNGAKITLGQDEFYMIGDNRANSLDSRFWGPVPRNDLVGRALFRVFPFQLATKFQQVKYIH